MYHWSLSSAIRFVVALVFLYVLFQTWFPPTNTDPLQEEPLASPDESPAVVPSSEQPSPQPLINAPTPPRELAPSFDAIQARLIDPGKPPSVELKRILDEFDQEHYQEVETRLERLSPKVLASERAKHCAAAIWNNLGVQQEQSFGIEVSVKAFKQATALAPHNPVALLNLTQAYWGLHDEALTPAFLESVLLVAPHDPFTHIALADLLLENGKMEEAAQHLTLAQGQALTHPSLKTYFQELTERLNHHKRGDQAEPAAGPAQPVSPSSNSVVSAHTESSRSSTVTEQSATSNVSSLPNGEHAGKPP